MAQARVVMNRAGYDAYRNDSSVVAALEEAATTIQERAQANVDELTPRPFVSPGPDIEVETVHNRSRAVVFVATGTLKARTAEAKNRALNRALG